MYAYQISLWVLLHVLGSTSGQTQETVILTSLGDHGDRIVDLEGTVKTLKAGFGGLQAEVTQLRQENAQLKSQIQNLNNLCNKSQCCQSCGQSQSNNYASTTNQPRTGTTFNTSLPVTKTSTTQKATTATQRTTTGTTPTIIPSTSTSTTASTTTSTTASTITSTTTVPVTSPTTQTTTSSQVTVYDNCWSALKDQKVREIVNLKIGSTGRTVRGTCDNHGWLIIQRRKDGSQSFDQNWDTYKEGFGNLTGEFWLGNENIYELTNSEDHILHIEMNDWASNHYFIEYDHFRLENEYNNYKLFVGSAMSGNAGHITTRTRLFDQSEDRGITIKYRDSFHYKKSYQLTHFQMYFSTSDRDNDKSFKNCAKELHSGWWFNDCYSSNLNGPYLSHPYGHRNLAESWGQPTLQGTGVEWYPIKRQQYSMKNAVMKMKTRTEYNALLG